MWYCRGKFLDYVTKYKAHPSHDSQCLDRDSNWSPPEQESEALLLTNLVGESNSYIRALGGPYTVHAIIPFKPKSSKY
jgi:hypothetical protein